MIGFRQVFCEHNYVEIARRKSQYCSDWHTFSDLGMYDDVKYQCTKCKRTKIKTEKNKSHPLYSEWKKTRKRYE